MNLPDRVGEKTTPLRDRLSVGDKKTATSSDNPRTSRRYTRVRNRRDKKKSKQPEEKQKDGWN
ncbi:hypothetical protein M378DRAFT_166921 [Amanita muscaria Koide BX008]|uniref:Uncharacterized protein n=1 Tax=Amanita muscaria (strain Koide BX008) TaxID=946122 RepID=A0A0C2T4J8_AMAMK|nr:hypothetical protein M378DRAFT_166921 [Amanita muscaria Koide BX008]